MTNSAIPVCDKKLTCIFVWNRKSISARYHTVLASADISTDPVQ